MASYLQWILKVGEAEVAEISPCPEIEAGTGEVVTGTFTHSSGDILDIQIEGESKPIGTTGNHPWWSEDRQKFVEASELKPGETLRTAAGNLPQVVSITKRANAETVYNLEVNREHVYYVGESGLLVHNTYPGILKGMSATEAKKLMGMWNRASFNSRAHNIRHHAIEKGFGNDIPKYLRKAANFNKKGASRKRLPGGRTRWNKGNEFLIELDGKIVTYGINS